MKIQLTLDSFAVMLYCSDLIPTNHPALTNEEWLEVEKCLKSSAMKDVSRLFGMHFDALTQLAGINEYIAKKILDRNTLMADLFYSLHNLENEGIQVTTKYEDNYPNSLLKLKKRAPLVLYYVGDLSLIKDDNVSIMGPQTLEKKLNFATKNIVTKIYDEGRTLITGGLKGIDAYATKTMLNLGGHVICFVSDHMFDKMKLYSKPIKTGEMLLICAVDPYAYFNFTNALDRNIYVCGLSKEQFVVATHSSKGPVYFTSLQNFHYHWTKQLVFSDENYSGNLRLIEMGAIPVTDEDLLSLMTIEEIIEKNEPQVVINEPVVDQMSIFEFIEK